MAPEYGATCGFFPVDDNTLDYLIRTGRSQSDVELVRAYTQAQGLWHDPEAKIVFDETVTFDLSSVSPTLAGPSRPEQRVSIADLPSRQLQVLTAPTSDGGYGLTPAEAELTADVQLAGDSYQLAHGHIAIAAITSCTNTSNPSGLVLAGLVANAAQARGLKPAAWVKTSFAPGSRAAESYLSDAGLLGPLEALGFNIVALGCTTCIGNSGPLDPAISAAVKAKSLKLAAVISGNRNFTGRVNPDVALNFLGSPGLVVAYALAGTTNINLDKDPLGYDQGGQPVYLRDLWPKDAEVEQLVQQFVTPEIFVNRYGAGFLEGTPEWRSIPVQDGPLFEFDPASTYIELPPWCNLSFGAQGGLSPIKSARVLAIAGSKTTTDHISPAGSFKPSSPAGQFLVKSGVSPGDFNSLGARRGSHRVMGCATLSSPTFVNRMLPASEKKLEFGMARDARTGEELSVWELSQRFAQAGIPAVLLAEQEYGNGSSRDWAAKGVVLQGVRAVIAASFERIHRSNLALMSVLPCVFRTGETWQSLGLDGSEEIGFPDLGNVTPGQEIELSVQPIEGPARKITVVVDLRTTAEVEIVRGGGILKVMLEKLTAA